MFPKWSLFHILAFFVKEDIALDKAVELDQASLTTLGKVGCKSHIGWNLKGQGKIAPCSCLKEKTMGCGQNGFFPDVYTSFWVKKIPINISEHPINSILNKLS